MASPAQIAANLANSQKSTGPRTDAGKQTASMNARKHGLTGQTVLRRENEDAAFQVFSSRMMKDLAPANDLELSFAERVVSHTWRLHHAEVIEQSFFMLSDSAVHDAKAFQLNEKTFTNLSLYMARIQRMLHKDLDLLHKMQKDRRADALRTAKEAAKRPLAVPPQPVERTIPFPEIGFDYPDPEPDSATPPSALETAPENMAA